MSLVPAFGGGKRFRARWREARSTRRRQETRPALRLELLEDRYLLSGAPLEGGDLGPAAATVVAAGDFLRIAPVGSLVSASLDNGGTVSGPGDWLDVQFNVLVGETVTATITPQDSSAVVSVELVGISGTFAAAGSGQAVVLPVTSIAAGGLVTLRVTSSSSTTVDVDIYKNAALEVQWGDSSSGNGVALETSALAVVGGRYAVVGSSQPTQGEIVVFAENFDGVSHSFTIDNADGTGDGLWHVTSGRQSDGLANHSPPKSLYFGQNETSTGGGHYDTGSGVGGSAMTPFFTLPSSGTLTLSFNTLVDVEDGDPAEILRVLVDDGTDQYVIMDRNSGEIPTFTAVQWVELAADLTDFAGQNIRLVFYFDTLDDLENNYEGWYIDDVRVTAELPPGPDVDYYTLDLTGKSGTPIDVLLAGLPGADFSTSVLEVVAPNGSTVLATATTNPLGVTATNYQLGVLGFVAPADGLYTVRFTSSIEGSYLLVVTESLTFDSEPNNQSGDALRDLSATGTALGFLRAGFVETFSSRGNFNFAHPGLPIEDFEEGQVAADDAVEVPGPLDASSSNAVFSAGDILAGLRIEDSVVGNTEDELVLVGSGFMNNPSKAVGANLFGSATDLVFTGGDVYAVGFDIYINIPGNVTITVHDTSDQLLTSQVVNVPAEGAFFGVASSEAIGRIRVASSNAELVDNIAFGPLGSGAGQAGSSAQGGSFGSDLYTVSLVAGQAYTVSTQTPLDGAGGAPQNSLDARLVVTGPGGAPTYSDDNSGGDGKNALVTFVATESGLYTIEVAAVSGGGEYLLSVSEALPPTITGVFARAMGDSSGAGNDEWSAAFYGYLEDNGLGNALGYRLNSGTGQLTTLPWTNVDTISVVFDKDVGGSLSAGSLVLVGSPDGPAVPALAAGGFSYDAGTFTASWQFASALAANKYLLHFADGTISDAVGLSLDGEWADGVSTSSGEGTAGGAFNFRFNVVPGDVDGNGSVSFSEAATVRANVGQSTATAGFNPRHDVNGSGSITAGGDVGPTRALATTTITLYSDPIPPSPGLLGGESSDPEQEGWEDVLAAAGWSGESSTSSEEMVGTGETTDRQGAGEEDLTAAHDSFFSALGLTSDGDDVQSPDGDALEADAIQTGGAGEVDEWVDLYAPLWGADESPESWTEDVAGWGVTADVQTEDGA